MARILVLTGDRIGAQMAGPAIRAFEMARLLGSDHDVRLVSYVGAEGDGDGFDVATVSLPTDMKKQAAWAEIVVFQGHALVLYPFLADGDRIVVADVYDPFHLERLEKSRQSDDDDRLGHAMAGSDSLSGQLGRADFILCATQRQRDLWLGHLGAVGRLNPELYDRDPSLDSFLAIAPFGIPSTPPERTGPGPRATYDAIGADDPLLIWAGGVYDWFDPLTTIEAVRLATAEVPNLRLLFMGLGHPNPGVTPAEVHGRMLERSAELGLTDEHVFFNHGWVPYDERQNHLLDADVGISTHHLHLETAFSFRTRMLDYLWTGLPIVATGGDAFGALIREHGLGAVVEPNDPEDLAKAIVESVEADVLEVRRAAVTNLASRFRWEDTLAPLVAFCADPRPAPDRRHKQTLAHIERRMPKRGNPIDIVRRDTKIAAAHLKDGGVEQVMRAARTRAKRVLDRG